MWRGSKITVFFKSQSCGVPAAPVSVPSSCSVVPSPRVRSMPLLPARRPAGWAPPNSAPVETPYGDPDAAVNYGIKLAGAGTGSEKYLYSSNNDFGFPDFTLAAWINIPKFTDCGNGGSADPTAPYHCTVAGRFTPKGSQYSATVADEKYAFGYLLTVTNEGSPDGRYYVQVVCPSDKCVSCVSANVYLGLGPSHKGGGQKGRRIHLSRASHRELLVCARLLNINLPAGSETLQQQPTAIGRTHPKAVCLKYVHWQRGKDWGECVCV